MRLSRVLRWSQGGGLFLMSEVTLYSTVLYSTEQYMHHLIKGQVGLPWEKCPPTIRAVNEVVLLSPLSLSVLLMLYVCSATVGVPHRHLLPSLPTLHCICDSVASVSSIAEEAS